MKSTTFLPLLLASAGASPTEGRTGQLEERAPGYAHCKDFNIPVTAHALNKRFFKPTDDFSTVDGVTSFLSSSAGIFSQLFAEFSTGGNFPISARYCAPSKNAAAPPERANHVQLLLHGIPYTKNYWQGQRMPKGSLKYSWEAHMTAKGYPVLTIDNLGNGNSTVHPDPIRTVQQPLEVEIVHQIVKKMRAGTIGHGVPKASKVIYGGHSFASVLGNSVMTRHPKDFDAAFLTGYTYTLANGVPGALLAQLEPASLKDPARYGHLPPGYITFGNKFGKRQTYYAADGDFSTSVEDFDFANEGITTVGEIITFFSGLQKAPDFKGDVLTITGQEDVLFCGPGSRSIDPNPSCGKGKNSIPARSGQFFPNANYNFFMPKGASHATNLHHSSQSIFKQASAFLERNGY